MKKKREQAKYKNSPKNSETARIALDPKSYLEQNPVWRFSDFDWNGDWGYQCCIDHASKMRDHVEQHLASFETMTWGEILKASGGRSNGNNHHEIDRDKF